MQTDAIPRKTDAARAALANRAALPAALRLLLITIDGRKPVAELLGVARSLGLDGRAFAHLHRDGLIAWHGMPSPEQAQAQRLAAQATRLVKAKFYALDLAARMLAGKEGALREQARTVDSESSFNAWMDDCAASIARAADPQRAALFRERVAAAAA